MANPYPPIAAYALLSDSHSAALVSLDGSIDWCCFERFDARPVFARILDWSRGGHFQICPKTAYRSRRRYLPGTNIVETRFESDAGVLVLTDCLAVREIGDREAVDPYRQLIRLVRCVAGEVPIRVDFEPRFDYGLTTPATAPNRRSACRGVRRRRCARRSNPTWASTGPAYPRRAASGRSAPATRAYAVLTYAQAPSAAGRAARARANRSPRPGHREVLASTGRAAAPTRGSYREQVLRSALVLKGLTNAPTGAIVAAPTTSLPEEIGGARNWDYRYTWLRDAAFILYALTRWATRTSPGRSSAGWSARWPDARRTCRCSTEWAASACCPELELPGLDGYRGSRPVRIGNAAAGQFQLDIYGEVVDTIWLYHRYGGKIGPSGWESACRLVDYVEQRWTEPDEGIWEVRGKRSTSSTRR